MIRHIVMWKLLDAAGGKTREENLLLAQKMLLALPAAVPGIDTFQVGQNCFPGREAFDLVLNATFPSMQSLQAYLDHEEHQRVARFLRSVRSDRAVVDFEC